MKVLNISSNDWANYSYTNAKSLRTVGVHCEGVKLYPHSFGYAEQHPVVSYQSMIDKIHSGFDIIQVFNSDVRMAHALRGFKGRIVVYHTGTSYRRSSHEINQLFNPIVWKTVMVHGEFMGSGAKNETYLDRCVDVDALKPTYWMHQPYRFLHCPSNQKVKGTETIKRLFQLADISIKCDTNILPHEQSIARMHNCDVYVELFNPTLDGKKYGHFGITAIEAAALGKVVVTQNLSNDVYEKHYGSCPLILVKDETDFLKKIQWLNAMSASDLSDLQQAHRKWAVEKHSYKANGERIKKILEL